MTPDRGAKVLERRLSPMRDWPSARPARGWLRAIREALGMTATQYARRLGVSQPRIAALERSEAEETVTLATLRRAAEALDCRLVYAIVPNQPLERTLRDRAELKSDQQLAHTSHSMGLEDQALGREDVQVERERLIDSLLHGDPRRLWDA